MGNMISAIRRNPVAFLTTLYTVLAAVAGVVTTLHVLPDKVTGILIGVVAVLAAVLGAITHGKVTPLVDPRDNAGRQLVAFKPGGPVK